MKVGTLTVGVWGHGGYVVYLAIHPWEVYRSLILKDNDQVLEVWEPGEILSDHSQPSEASLMDPEEWL